MNTDSKIAVCSRSFSRNLTLRDKLLSEFKNVKFNDEGLSLSGDRLVEYLDGFDGAIIALEVVDRYVLSKLPDLKFIGKYGVGLDKIDFEAMEEFGVKLGWTPGVNAQGVAELTVALALTTIRNINKSHELAKQNEWRQVTGRQLSSMSYGILGCGHVGKALAKLLVGFGCTVLAHDIENYDEFYQEYGVRAVTLEQLMQESDILSIHLPRNLSTIGLIDSTRINQMRKGSYIVNTARGGIVDENAVIAALDSGQLSAVAFDVLAEEPPTEMSFIHHPRAYITTHIAGSSEEAILAMGFAAIEGLSRHYPVSKYKKYQ